MNGWKRRGVVTVLAASVLVVRLAAGSASGSVTISGPDSVSVGETIELVAQGSPPGGVFSWILERSGRQIVTAGKARLLDERVRIRASGDRLSVTGLSPSAAPGDIRVRVTYEQGGTSCTDVHALTCVSGELTAHRPRTPAGYAPFVRTPVGDADEESATLGPGIRINGNGDADPGGEDDLIEVRVDVTPANTGFVLRRSAASLRVWTTLDRTPGTELTFAGGVTGALPFAAGQTQLVLGVEWGGTGHGTAGLTLERQGSAVVQDRLVFHTFHSIVMALGGEDQVPSDPADPNHGTFEVAIVLYELGYDVHMHDEDDVGPAGLGPVYDEVVTAIQDRGVDEVAIYGYSHGGGSTHDLSDRLDVDRAGIGVFDIVFTSYVDSVENSSDVNTAMELRYPPSSAYHVNQYQHGSFFEDLGLDGGPVPGSNPPPSGLDVETTVWGAAATHFTVDDFVEARDLIRTSFLPRVTR